MGMQLVAKQVIITEIYQSAPTDPNKQPRLYCTILDTNSSLRASVKGTSQHALREVSLLPVDLMADLSFINLKDKGGLIVELSNMQVVDKFKLRERQDVPQK